jgi:hypothetical protein
MAACAQCSASHAPHASGVSGPTHIGGCDRLAAAGDVSQHVLVGNVQLELLVVGAQHHAAGGLAVEGRDLQKARITGSKCKARSAENALIKQRRCNEHVACRRYQP